MDFYKIKERTVKKGVLEVYPDFKVCRSKDLMVRGKSFYAIWDSDKKLWSTDEYDVQRLVDADLMRYKKEKEEDYEGTIKVRLMSDFSSKLWSEFRMYMNQLSNNATQLDNTLVFQNSDNKKEMYSSKKLPYCLEKGPCDAFKELMAQLYDSEDRAKLEWCIGAVVTGDSKTIQKFLVLYGQAGAGKSTILNIIQRLFEGYYTTFEAKALTSSSNSFSTEVFKENPLVGIQHDGDLSKIEDNTKLNSIISHEEMVINEKFKSAYTSKMSCFLFMATNKPVKITDAKSGIIRRLIDVEPSGRRFPPEKYEQLMNRVQFELGHIAYYCAEVYKSMGRDYYSGYTPTNMMLQTDVFYNFVEGSYFVFKEQDGVTLSQAYEMYKQYCDDSLVEYRTPKYRFREELKNYFKDFYEMTRVDGTQVRNYYSGFKFKKFEKMDEETKYCVLPSIDLKKQPSIFDRECSDYQAQYASGKETPTTKWSDVKTLLKDLDTSKLHYVRPDKQHIVIDFDLKVDGEKSLEANIEAASSWTPTYTEVSKGGNGLHLHYKYTGDVSKIDKIYSEGIEIKVFTGRSSLRRKLTLCNDLKVATISSGLPLKGEKMVDFEVVKNEKKLVELIKKNLRKEVHPGTKPSMDFIKKLLDDAYESGMKYDVTAYRPKILSFAMSSTNQSAYCLGLLKHMKFKSDHEEVVNPSKDYERDLLVFFDVEVFPNLFVLVWKTEGGEPVQMINPTSKELEPIMNFKLVGFNNRKYDNHILYARYMGYTNEELYTLSQRIINNSPNSMFREAYNLSYTDIYDFSSAGNKKSLKKWQIELGLTHHEMRMPWDMPVEIDSWPMVAEYCTNDVITTEAVFNHLRGDYQARRILADISGLTPNHTTNSHTTKIIFGNERNPQSSFNYVDLKELFPGYEYSFGTSTYRGIKVGEGGYVYAEPGMYNNVGLLDIASMHPASIEAMELFGPYTKYFIELKQARLAVKNGKFDEAAKMMDGKLKPYLDPEYAKPLSDALKTAINSVYGLTSASFDNPFKDKRNVDNIVAKRGALFMLDLQHAVQAKGGGVAHIKTDSIKIPGMTQDMAQFVIEFGKKYGYDFEHEETYEKMCLVNDAVYIAKKKSDGKWTATGTQFKHPYVFKKLFSEENIEFEDLCEVKSVKTCMYLDMNEDLTEDDHDYRFVGRVGSFIPILPGKGGGMLLREKDGKYHAVTGTKGYRWLESEVVKNNLDETSIIDMSYYDKICEDAINNISKYGDFDIFVNERPPWLLPCGDENMGKCSDCKDYPEGDKEICYKGYSIVPF